MLCGGRIADGLRVALLALVQDYVISEFQGSNGLRAAEGHNSVCTSNGDPEGTVE